MIPARPVAHPRWGVTRLVRLSQRVRQVRRPGAMCEGADGV